MAYARGSGPLASRGRTFLDWLTGTGFLTVDAVAFFVSLVVLIPWNLFRTPGDFWVAEPLRSWAFLLAFHALVVGAISLARGIVRSPEETDQHEVDRPAVAWRVRAPEPVPARSAAQVTASSLLAEEWARRWISEPAVNSESHDLLDEIPEAPGGYVNGNAEFGRQWLAGDAQVVWPEPPEADPARDDAETILADWLESEVETVQKEQIDPLRAAARVQAPGPDDAELIDAELEWKWVEAAASAWLSKRRPPGDSIQSNGSQAARDDDPASP
jgi:hypothetical protein